MLRLISPSLFYYVGGSGSKSRQNNKVNFWVAITKRLGNTDVL